MIRRSTRAASRQTRRAARAVAVAIALGLTCAQVVVAASPSPEIGGDPRSSGQGPGLVGEPGLAILAVVAIGVGALLVTLAYVRLTGGGHR